ncbi:PorT family protein [Adhaeribacter rhizoryzae]|uniref:PorT family protein n=1 Tax=Adhaeribacter rhizoryzae TaxID=2607907 RepID=A0A5M6DTJ6_9BACT|nr:PorT family protein [Adhaeribacter rhizoryzae]
MAFSYLRHQFYLYRFKIIFSFLVFLLLVLKGFTVSAQDKKYIQKNLSNHDDKPMHYGFYLAGNTARFTLEHSDYYVDRLRDSMTVNPKFYPGFAIGFVLNRRITDFIDLRFLPGVSFYSRGVEYKTSSETVTQEMGATSIEFPLLFKFKSLRRSNVRMYLVGGAKAGVDIGNKKKANASNQLEVNTQDFAIEYGVGLDMFYPFFKFAPELRFSNGITNRYAAGVNPYSRSVQAVRSNTVTLYLNFEN